MVQPGHICFRSYIRDPQPGDLARGDQAPTGVQVRHSAPPSQPDPTWSIFSSFHQFLMAFHLCSPQITRSPRTDVGLWSHRNPLQWPGNRPSSIPLMLSHQVSILGLELPLSDLPRAKFTPVAAPADLPQVSPPGPRWTAVYTMKYILD